MSNKEDRLDWLFWVRTVLREFGLRDYVNVLTNLWETRRGRTILRSRLLALTLEITTHCNLRCKMCPSTQRPRQHMPFADYRRLMADPFLSGWFVVTFLGVGESLLHPEFFEMVAEARRRHKTVVLFSNGTRFDPETVDKLVKSGILRVIVSIDSPNAETYRTIRGTSLSGVVEGVKRLTSAIYRHRVRAEVVLTTVAMAENLKQLPDMVDLACECGAKGLHVQHVEPSYVDVSHNPAWLRENTISRNLETQWTEVCGSLFRRAQERKLFLKLKPLPKRPKARECMQPWQSMYIRVNGDVGRCCLEQVACIGNAFETPLTRLWNGAGMRELRSSLLGGNTVAMCSDCTNY